MSRPGNLVVKIGMLSLLSVIPLAALSDDSVVFTVPFPFYADNVKLPAGTYRLTQPNPNDGVVILQNIAGTQEKFIDFTPTSSLDAAGKTDLTFQKYGDTGYLKTLTIAGETDGMEFKQDKAEARVALSAESTTVIEQATVVRGE